MTTLRNFNKEEGGRFDAVTLFFISIVIIFGLISYSSCLNNGFVWDDSYLIVNNGYIRDVSFIGDVFRQDLLCSDFRQSNTYRPLQPASYMADYYLFGLNPEGFHLASVALHLVNAALLFFIVFAVTKNNIMPFIASLLFVVHPAHTQAVSYISGRADLLMGCFVLLSFILFIYTDGHRLKTDYHRRLVYACSLMSFILALLSKEAAVIFPLAILAYTMFFKDPSSGRKSFYPYFAISGVYIIIRAMTLNRAAMFTSDLSLYERSLTFLKSIIYYLKFLIMPVGLCPSRAIQAVRSIFDPFVLAALTLVTLAILVIIRARRQNPLIAFSLAWFFIWLLPVSGILPLNAIISENWLYLPSVGIFILAACFIAKLFLYEKGSFYFKNLKILFLGILVVALAGMTFKQNTYWKNPETLFNRILSFAPRDPAAFNNLGVYYQGKGELERALDFYEKAVELDPGYAYAYYNMGLYYYGQNDPKRALADFTRCVDLKPNHSDAHVYIGLIKYKQGKAEEAVASYKKALAADPNNGEAHLGLGNIYSKKGFLEQTVSEYSAALDGNSVRMELYGQIGQAFAASGHYREALKAFSKAAKIDKRSKTSYLNLGHAYMKLKQYGRAASAYKKAIKIDANCADAYYNLGNLYNELGQAGKARHYWRKTSLKI